MGCVVRLNSEVNLGGTETDGESWLVILSPPEIYRRAEARWRWGLGGPGKGDAITVTLC